VISSPFVIILSDTEKAVLAARAASARAEHREVVRARIVLAAAQGQPNAAMAAASPARSTEDPRSSGSRLV
jgi:hypothetical protein